MWLIEKNTLAMISLPPDPPFGGCLECSTRKIPDAHRSNSQTHSYLYVYEQMYKMYKSMDQYTHITGTLWYFNVAIENGPVEIVDFPMKNGWIFP